jgi:hypothetical protein
VSPILGIWASQNYSRYSLPTSFESIATANGTGSGATITFSSIPSTFTHLQLRYVAKSTGSASYLIMTFNGNTTNYDGHYLGGNGTSASAGRNGVTNQMEFYNGVANTTTGVAAAGIIDILDYTNTSKYRTVRGLTGVDYNGSGGLYLGSGLFMSTTAVSTIGLTLNTGNFTTDTKFALYGIKGA